METYHSNMTRRWVLSLQRLGRMVRQGNQYSKVYLYRYTTKGTFDAYLFQTLEAKQKFISQVMTSKNPVRSCDNIDEDTLDFAEVKALCSGNPLIKEKLQLDVDIKKLNNLKSSFKQTKYRLEDEVNNILPADIANYRSHLELVKSDVEDIKKNYSFLFNDSNENSDENSNFQIKIGNVVYNERSKATDALRKAISAVDFYNLKSFDDNEIGSYAGLNISIMIDQYQNSYRCRLSGHDSYSFDVGNSALGFIRRVENKVKSIVTNMQEQYQEKLDNANLQYSETKNLLNEKFKVFDLQNELDTKQARLKELNAQLAI